MFRFAHPDYFIFLIVLPLLAVLFYYGLIVKSRRLDKLGEKRLLSALMPEVSHWRPRVRFLSSFIALTLIVFVMAGPQFGTKLETVKRKGIEVIVAIDVSNSMLSQDLKPSRMQRAKQILSRVIDGLDNDKVGLIVFAGDAYVQMPMSTDASSAKMFLSSIDPGMVPVQGTAIGSAIRMAMGLFSGQEDVSRSIVVITDGENHEDDAVAMAKMARDNGVTVNVVGVGTPQGSPIPVPGTNSFHKDSQGNVVVTKLNEQMCNEIAEAGGGLYVRADNAGAAVRALTSELDEMSKTEIESQVYSDYNEQFAPFAWVALFLILAGSCLTDRKNPLFKNVRLF